MVGAFNLVFHAGSFLSGAFFVICASMDFTVASTAAGLDLPSTFVDTGFFVVSAGAVLVVSWANAAPTASASAHDAITTAEVRTLIRESSYGCGCGELFMSRRGP